MLENNGGMNGAMTGAAGLQNIDPTQPSTSNGFMNVQQQQPQQQQQQQPPPQQQQQQQIQQQRAKIKKLRHNVYVKIVEQPAAKALRFRYECEGRSAGSIPGVNSTPENKTYPTIEVVGYKGRAIIVVSCVTKDEPYRPHPHNLVGKEGCSKGVCTLEINKDTMRAVFSNLGIQCVKKMHIESALQARKEIRVDPFRTGYDHKNQPSSIDLNSVRLCFQVFLREDDGSTIPLQPVVSDPIFDKKAMSELVISRLCSCSSTVEGGKEIILLCEKVAKEDISVRFFEEQNGNLVWEGFGDFQHTDVHKQTAITFKTPRYRTVHTNEVAKVFIQLRRPSDGATSEALPFDFLPISSDPAEIKRKRQKTGGDPIHHLKRVQELHAQHPIEQLDGRVQQINNFSHLMPNQAIKTEPRDTSPLPYMLNNAYRLPDTTPSPQPVSPPYPYHQNTSSTPSPFHMGAASAGGNGNVNTMSPNRTYNYGPTAGPGLVHSSSTDFGVYHQQQQQQQMMQQQQQQQQLGVGNTLNQYPQPMYSSPSQPSAVAAQQWQNAPQFGQPMPNNSINNLMNLNNIPYNSQPWNVPAPPMPIANNNFNVDQMLANTQQPAIPNHGNVTYHGQGQALGGGATTTSNNIETPSLSSLLNMDSEQLMELNSADLTNLSISGENADSDSEQNHVKK